MDLPAVAVYPQTMVAAQTNSLLLQDQINKVAPAIPLSMAAAQMESLLPEDQARKDVPVRTGNMAAVQIGGPQHLELILKVAAVQPVYTDVAQMVILQRRAKTFWVAETRSFLKHLQRSVA